MNRFRIIVTGMGLLFFGHIVEANVPPLGTNNFALQFDGQQNFVQSTNAFNQTISAYTVEAWFIGTSVNGQNPAIISTLGDDIGFNSLCDIVIYTNSIAFNPRGMGGLTANLSLLDGNWHHVACVWDGGQVRLYVDGQLVASEAGSENPFLWQTPLRLAYRDTNGGCWFGGIIAQVRISSVARYTGQIFSPPTSYPVDPSTIVYWPCNDGSPRTVTDATGNDNGVLYGSPLPSWVALTPGLPNSWTDSSDKWENAADWSLGVAPSSSEDSDYVTNANTKTVTIDATTATNALASLTIHNLTVSAPLGSTNTVLINNAGMAIPLAVLNTLAIDNNGAVVVNNSAVQTYGNLLVGITGNNAVLAITNGAAVISAGGYVGDSATSSNNMVVVSGTSSLWTNSGSVYVGYAAAANELIITNGGVVFSPDSYLGYNSSASNNMALVSGTGSVWSNSGDLVVGNSGTGNQLILTNGGALFASNLVLGANAGGSGMLTLGGGMVSVTSLILTNAGSTVIFNGGLVNSAGATIINGLTFLDGDGIDAATYYLLGGVHSFANGLEIRNNASLTGCGTIDGNVLVDAGGSVLANCGGELNFTGTVTNNGTISVVSGTAISFFGVVVNNATVVATNGAVYFFGGFVNNGTLLSSPNNSWIDGTGKWETSGNWSTGVTPSDADPADLITNAATKTVTIDATTVLSNNVNGCLTINYLSVSAPTGSINTLALNNMGTASTPLLVKGPVFLGGGGIITVTNSELEVDTTGGGPEGVDGALVGVVGSGNRLIVSNGGEVFNGYGYIGYGSSASNNTAIISGSGSVWSNGNDLTIGDSGQANQLIITNGGAVFDNNGYLSYSRSSSDNSALVTGPGSVWANQSGLSIGTVGDGNSLTIANGGTVYSTSGNVGGVEGGSGAAVLVTGSGSVWEINGGLGVAAYSPHQPNMLTITNGGAVFASDVFTGSEQDPPEYAMLQVTGTGSVCSISGELLVNDGALTIANGGVVYSGSGADYDDGYGAPILVTDSGSVWYISGGLVVDEDGGGSLLSMTVANGGAVSSSGVDMEGYGPSTLLVTGTGSVWSNSADLTIGAGDNAMTVANGGAVYNSGDLSLEGEGGIGGCGQLTITDGGTVLASNVYCSVLYSCVEGIAVLGGALYVTNALGNGVLDMLGSILSLNGGTVTVDSLVASNSTPYGAPSGTVLTSIVSFTSGTLNTKGTLVSNSFVFAIGDGTDAATFQLNGGVHSFANNLLIDTHATLSGCGTVNGNVVVEPGGTVLANCGGELNFTGVVANNGSIYAFNGTTLNFYGPVVNNGLIDASKGYVQFWSGVQNNGTIVPSAASALRITSITKEGNDIRVAWICDGGHSYALQSTKSTAMIAEYNTNFADASPIIVASGVGLSTTNYLDAGAAYAPVLTAPGGTMVTTSTVPSTVDCSAVWTRGITDSLGNALPVGSLLMLGTFSISESTIQSNFTAGNVSAIMSNFTPYSTPFAVGNGTGLSASWDVSESAAGFGGQQIYLLAVDAPTLAAANHLGIYTAPSWTFPADGCQTNIDLEDVTDFVIGAQGGSLTLNLVLGGETYTFTDTARLSVLPGRILFYRVRLVP
ncbi:MAG: LamG-like jellyroll fold domain-containing protein [Verrucomicrobiia bacterium]|jgi:T5SS/PEP-CTERM-associated repeat protein